MSPTPASGSARSAAALNETIRAMWLRAGGRPFTAEERAEYEQLLEEWTAAVRAEVVAAA